jgi:hypothetical protein
MNKKFAIPLFALLLVGGVFASIYVFNHFILVADIDESLDVEYVILENGVDACADYVGLWESTQEDGNLGPIHPGESKKICFQITNYADVDTPYVIYTSLQEDSPEECESAFSKTMKSGIVNANGVKMDAQVLTVPFDASAVNDCLIKVSVARGTEE